MVFTGALPKWYCSLNYINYSSDGWKQLSVSVSCVGDTGLGLQELLSTDALRQTSLCGHIHTHKHYTIQILHGVTRLIKHVSHSESADMIITMHAQCTVFSYCMNVAGFKSYVLVWEVSISTL